MGTRLFMTQYPAYRKSGTSKKLRGMRGIEPSRRSAFCTAILDSCGPSILIFPTVWCFTWSYNYPLGFDSGEYPAKWYSPTRSEYYSTNCFTFFVFRVADGRRRQGIPVCFELQSGDTRTQ